MYFSSTAQNFLDFFQYWSNSKNSIITTKRKFFDRWNLLEICYGNDFSYILILRLGPLINKINIYKTETYSIQNFITSFLFVAFDVGLEFSPVELVEIRPNVSCQMHNTQENSAPACLVECMAWSIACGAFLYNSETRACLSTVGFTSVLVKNQLNSVGYHNGSRFLTNILTYLLFYAHFSIPNDQLVH